MSRLLLLGLLLLAQREITSNPFQAEINLEEERLKTLKSRPSHKIATVIGRYKDGSPMSKGWIGCEGAYHNHADDPDEEQVYTYFKADSRGAVVFLTYLGDEYMDCFAEQNGKTGRNRQWFPESGSMVMEIILR